MAFRSSKTNHRNSRSVAWSNATLARSNSGLGQDIVNSKSIRKWKSNSAFTSRTSRKALSQNQSRSWWQETTFFFEIEWKEMNEEKDWVFIIITHYLWLYFHWTQSRFNSWSTCLKIKISFRCWEVRPVHPNRISCAGDSLSGEV